MTGKERDELLKNFYASIDRAIKDGTLDNYLEQASDDAPEAALDQMTDEQFMRFYGNVCEANGVANPFAEELNGIKKPPLGVAPPGIVYDERMRDLASAILRRLEPERAIACSDYACIAKWSEELHEVALLMIKLLK